jgi:Tol biopolymer transport system component/imidazolonepropionase-like amidohydrolase
LLAQLYRVPITGGEAQCLTQSSGVALNYHPRFSPDGREIVFVSDRGGQDNLWVMNADGSSPRPLVIDYRAHLYEPAWAPDGRSVIVRRQEAELLDNEVRTSIWRYPRDGKPGTELVGPNEQLSYPYVARGPSSPSISRDGRHLYYQIFVGTGPRKSASIDVLTGSLQIRRIDLQTREVEPITGPIEGGFAPEISPDGRWLAFAQRIPDGILEYRGHRLTPRTALWIRNLETGAERLVADPIEIDAAEDGLKTFLVLPKYAWAADGKSIVFAQGGKLRRVALETGAVETIRFTASVRRTISEMARARFRIPDDSLEAKFLRWPSASPDGGTVAFQALGRIWLVDGRGPSANGRLDPPRRLTPATFEPFEYGPTWSPDGRWIAFTGTDRQGRTQVWKAPSTGGPPVQVSAEAAEYYFPIWTPDGRSLIVTRGTGATLRGRMLLETLWYDVVQLPADGGGPPRRLGRIGRTGHEFSAFPGMVAVRLSLGPEGRLYYPGAAVTKDRGLVTVLQSVRADGTDRRDHLTLAYGNDVTPSPDGKWVAYEENENVYVTRLTPAAATAPLLDRNDPRAKRLTTTGGLYPRWRNPTTLDLVGGTKLLTHHVESGRTDTTTIRLRVARPTPAGTIALTNARIITLDSTRRVIEAGTLVVTGSRITCLGSCETGRVDRIIDLSGKTVIPGFVDTHLHYPRPSQSLIPPQVWETALYFSYGVTASREPGDWPQHSVPLANLIDAGLVIGPRIHTVGGIMNSAPFGSGRGDVATGRSLFHDTPTSTAALDEIDRIRNWAGEGVALKTYYQPARDRRQWLVEAARRRGISTTAENDDLFVVLGQVMDGYSGFEHSIRNVPLLSDVAQFLGQARVVYSSTLSAGTGSQRQKEYWLQELDVWREPKMRLWQPWSVFIAEQRRVVKRPVTDYRFPIYAQGVADVISRGGYATIGSHGEIDGIGVHTEIWMNAAAMSPMLALEVASKHGAYFLGADQDIGSLEVGKLADLLVLNRNPLENIRNTLDMAYVMKGGRLYDDDTLNEIWPESRPYGPRPWINQAMLRTDLRSIDHHDRSH